MGHDTVYFRNGSRSLRVTCCHYRVPWRQRQYIPLLRWKQQIPPKRWQPSIQHEPHGTITQMATNWILTTDESSLDGDRLSMLEYYDNYRAQINQWYANSPYGNLVRICQIIPNFLLVPAASKMLITTHGLRVRIFRAFWNNHCK
jgi:hypothetical protein